MVYRNWLQRVCRKMAGASTGSGQRRAGKRRWHDSLPSAAQQLEKRLLLSASVSGNQNHPEGSLYQLTLDDGGATADWWELNWGDGSSETVNGQLSVANHVYTDGPNARTIVAEAFSPGNVFQEQDGRILIEAENFSAQQPGTGSAATHSWSVANDSNAGGTSFLSSSPVNGYSSLDQLEGPRLDYEVDFHSTGTWYVWVHLQESSTGSGSVHVGLNGTAATLGHSGVQATDSQWAWQGHLSTTPTVARIELQVTAPGEQTLNVWMREAGVKFDRVLLTQDINEVPTGIGDAESITAKREVSSLAVQIDDVAPTLTISGIASITEGETYSLSLSSSDPGLDTISEWTIDWGDGAVETLAGNPNLATHVYTDGDAIYQITATAEDEDGVHSANSLNLNVSNVAPTLTISGDATSSEGALYTLNLSSSDPGQDTIAAWEINWGDGNVETISGNPSTVTHVFLDDSPGYTISATVTDEDGTHSSNSVVVAVSNVLPMVSIAGSAIISEGGSYVLTLSHSDPGDDTVSQWTIDWGDGITEIVPGSPASVTHQFLDGPANHTIRAWATDEDGTYNTTSVAVSVTNEQPVAAVSGATSILEGSEYTLALSVTEHGLDSISQWDIDWGDGTIETWVGNPAFAYHIYADGDASYTITASVTDEDGVFSANSIAVTVTNVVAYSVSGPVAIDEQGTYTLALVSNDPGQDTLTEWEINWGDGTIETIAGHLTSATHVFDDGPVQRLITASVTDEDGTHVTNSVTVDVRNVAPALSISGDASIAEGSLYTLNLSSTEVADDTITSWTIDWGDGFEEIISGNPTSVTHTYADGSMTYTIAAQATDEDGTHAANSLSVVVTNVDHAVTIAGPTTIDEGAIYTLDLSGTDIGRDTIQEWTVNWGDGSSDTVTGSPASLTHFYADGANSYTITATATDEDGTFASNPLPVTVSNVAPDLTIHGPTFAIAGASYTLQLTSHDPGADTITQWEINWGDGTIETVTGNPSSTTHTYSSSGQNYTISATATDEDGTYSANSLNIETRTSAPNAWVLGSGVIDEGSTFTLDLNGAAGITSWDVNWGDGITETFSGSTLSVTHTYSDGDSVATISATASDGSTNYPADSVTVQIRNVAPTLTLNGSSPISEGDSFTLNLSSLDPGSDTISGWWIDWGDGNTETVSGNPPSVSHNYVDGLNYTVRATATDEDGTYLATPFVLVVNNSAPTLTITGAATTSEGAAYSLQLNAADPGKDTIEIWTIDWGDGTTSTVTGSPQRVTHVFADGPLTHTITATATDEDGSYASNALTVTVNNVANPLISGPASVLEGSVYTLQLDGNDPGADTIASWSINWGDCQTELVAGNPGSVTHIFADDLQNYTISATATDEDGTFASNSLNVQVIDVAPTFTLSGPSNALEGAPYTLQLEVSDPGQDTVSEWIIDWGDGRLETVTGSPTSADHVYLDGDATYRISARGTNEDGTWRSNSILVVVANVAPAPTISGASSVAEGSPYLLALQSSDPGRDTITSWTINWGDGNTTTVSGQPSSVQHTYADGLNSHTITATATDEDGLYSSNSLSVTVTNVAPSVVISGTGIVDEGSPYTLNLSTSDPGQETIVEWFIDWGDGQTDTIIGNPGSVDHTYLDGNASHSVVAFAIDEDGTFVSNSHDVMVRNVAPTLTISGSATSVEGGLYVLDLASQDPGPDTITQWTISWGDGTVQTINGNPSQITHVFSDGPQTYTIQATATDEDGVHSSNAWSVNVSNVDPTLLLSGPETAAEGSQYVLSLSSSDPGDDSLIEWIIDWGDGTTSSIAGSATTATHTYADGDNFYTITATARDEDGTYAAGNSVSVAVENVDPILTISGNATALEGAVYNLTLSVLDPGADTIASWTIDWGDGTIQTIHDAPPVVGHVYADGPNSYTISATATDEDGTYSSNSHQVSVQNVAPTLTLSGNRYVLEDTTYTLNMSNLDPGQDTITSWTIDWGDGHSEVVAGNPTSWTHQYADPGIRVVTATATDEDGTYLSNSHKVYVGRLLVENTDFHVEDSIDVTVPASPSKASFYFFALSFDTSDLTGINDAFELALVDSVGQPLVPTIGNGRDAFFNISEELPEAMGVTTTFDEGLGHVQVDLTQFPAGFAATLLARLVNNDSDTTTQVAIVPEVEFEQVTPGPLGSAVPQDFATEPGAVDFSGLADVTPSVDVEYQTTSYADGSGTLHIGLNLNHVGSYPVHLPLILAVENISSAAVTLVEPDGFLENGSPYYNLSQIAEASVGPTLDPGETVSNVVLRFENLDEIQFSYTLKLYGELNQAPTFTSTPHTEVPTGGIWIYGATASDPNEDPLQYFVVNSPAGLTIDPDTGDAEWETGSTSLGSYPVVLRVVDPHGADDFQSFSVTITDGQQNQLPEFTSIPEVDAYVGEQYVYPASAFDPDGDELAFSVASGPSGFAVVDAESGFYTWTPTPDDLAAGFRQVTVQVSDGRGGVTRQNYRIIVHPDPNNQNPIITTEPSEQYTIPDLSSNPPLGNVDPTRLDLSLTRGEEKFEQFLLSLDQQSAHSADIVIVVDESGSMTTEHDWIATMVTDLDARLQAQGIHDNRFALIPYENGSYKLNPFEHPFTALLYDPNDVLIENSEIASIDHWNSFIETLPADGEYVLVLVPKSIDEVDGFGIAMDRVQPMIQTSSLTLNEIVSGAIPNVGDIDRYAFTIDEPTDVYVDSLSTGVTGLWKIHGPNGTIDGPLDQVLRLEAGYYTLDVTRSELYPAGYTFRLIDLHAVAEPLTFGTTTIPADLGYDTVVYSLSLDDLQTLYFEAGVTSQNGLGTWSLIDPAGEEVFSQFFAGTYPEPGEFELSDQGDYLLVIDRVSDQELSFNVFPFVAASGTALTFGEEVSGAISSSGEQQVYSFSLTERSHLFFDAMSSNSNLLWTLQGPGGTEVDQRELRAYEGYSSDPQIYYTHGHVVPDLPAGDYELVFEGNQGATGTYQFRLLNLQQATTITPGTYNDSLPGGKGALAYQVDVTGDESWHFFSKLKNKNFYAGRRMIVDPYGEIIWDQQADNEDLSNPKYQQVNFEHTGPHWLIFDGLVTESSSSVSVQMTAIQDLETVGTLTWGELNDTISDSYGIRRYDFNLTQATDLFVNIPGYLTGEWTLPDGSTATLTEGFQRFNPGDYQLRIFNTGLNSMSFQLQLHRIGGAENEALTIGSPFSRDVPGTERNLHDFFQFTATAGDEFDFQTPYTFYNDPRTWTLYDPAGHVVFSELVNNPSGEVGPVRLTQSGDYLLVVNRYVATTLTKTYGFEVTFLGNTAAPSGTGMALTLGSPVTDTLAAQYESDFFHFTLSDPSLIQIERLGGMNIRYSLTGPYGAVVTNSVLNLTTPGRHTVPAGLYELEIEANPGYATGTYDFQVVDLTSASTLTPGTVTTANVDPGSGSKAYQFTAAAGDAFYFDHQSSTTSSGRWNLLDPTGNVLFNVTSGVDGGRVVLAETATYTLVFDAPAGSSSPHELTFNVVPEVVNSANLLLNTSQSGSIASIGQQDRYLFTLTDRTLTTLDVLQGSGTIAWSLIGPEGTIVLDRSLDQSDAGDVADEDAVFDLLAGDYELIVNGIGTATGGYEFQLADLSVAAPLPVTGSTTGTLVPANQTAGWSFDGEIGQSLVVDVTSFTGASGGRWRLVSPFGKVLDGQPLQTGQTLVTLDAEGSWTFLIEGDLADSASSANYAFSITETSASLTPLILGATTVADVSLGSTVGFEFTLSAQTLLSFDSFSDRSDLFWSLADDTREFIRAQAFSGASGSSRQGSDLVFTLEPGTYSLTVFGTSSSSGQAQFRLLDVANAAQPLTIGQTASGQVTPNSGTVIRSFSATNGEEFYFLNSNWTGNSSGRWRLVDPLGRTVFAEPTGTDAGRHTLIESGTYHILVEAAIDETTAADYGLLIQPVVKTTQSLTLDQPVAATIASAGEQHVYEFAVRTRTNVYFDALSSNSDIAWSLIGCDVQPVAERRFDQSNAGDLESGSPVFHLLPGTYSLVVEGVSAATAAYEFQLLNLTNVPAITIDQSATGQLSTGLSTTSLKFTADAGDLLKYGPTNWTGGNQTLWSLVDPRGRIILTQRMSDPPTVRPIELDGTYTILIEGADAIGTSPAFEFLVSTATTDPNSIVNATTTGTISTSGEVVDYQFAGLDGQRLHFAWRESDSDYFTMQVLDPSGASVLSVGYSPLTSASNLNSYSDLTTLTSSGTYTVRITGNGGATGNFGFHITDVGYASMIDWEGSIEGSFGSALDAQVFRFLGQSGESARFESSPWGNSAKIASRIPLLDADGDEELGYDALEQAALHINYRPDTLKHIIFVTDEDDDGGDRAETAQGVLEEGGIPFHSVIGVNIDVNGLDTLGYVPDGSRKLAFRADGIGGYTVESSENVQVFDVEVFGSGGTLGDYVALADLVDGSVWSLPKISLAGPTTTSFTTAFVDYLAGIHSESPIDLIFSDPDAPIEIVDLRIENGDLIADVALTGDGGAYAFDAEFIRSGSPERILGSIPITIRPAYEYDADAYDPDGDPLIYTLVGEDHGATFDDTTGHLVWDVESTGDYEFTVRVEDDRGGFDIQTWTVTVGDTAAGNTAPIIDAAGPFDLEVGRPFQIQMSGHDPDNDVITWGLIADAVTGASIPGGMEMHPLNGFLTWTPTIDDIGSHTILVSAIDGRGGRTLSWIELSVAEPTTPLPINHAPEFLGLPPETAEVGVLYRYAPLVRDFDQDPLQFSLGVAPHGMAIEPNSGVISWRPSADQVGGPHPVVIVLRDTKLGVVTQRFDISVSSSNQLPIVLDSPASVATESELYSGQLAAIDPDSQQPVTWSLTNGPTGLQIDASGAVSWPIPILGTFTISAVATDDEGGTTDFSWDVTVLSATNQAPTIETIPRSSIRGEWTFVQRFTATDLNQDRLSWSLISGPNGMTITDDGWISWQTTADDIRAAAYPYTIRVEDGRGGSDEQTFELFVTHESTNSPPTITSTLPSVATVDQEITLTLTGDDVDGDSIWWSLLEGPDNLVIDAATGQFSWTPPTEQIGEQVIRILAADAYGGFDILEQAIAVRGTFRPPTTTPTPVPVAVIGQQWEYWVSATDPQDLPLLFELDAVSEAAGVAIDPATGQLTWTSSQIGQQPVTVTVSNGVAAVEQSFVISILSAPLNQVPIITTEPAVESEIGVEFRYDFHANDEDPSTLSWTLTAPNGMPNGVIFNEPGKFFTWTPDSLVENQSIVFVLTATDAGGLQAVQSFAVLARPANVPPIISPIGQVTISGGATYRYDVEVTNSDNDFLTYSLDQASVTRGMTIDPLGRITWMTDDSDLGSYTVDVNVADHRGMWDMESFQLTVVEDQTPPEVSVEFSPGPVDTGVPLDIKVNAVDDVAVVTRTLKLVELDTGSQIIPLGQEVPLDGNFVGTVIVNSFGMLKVEATATDINGNSATTVDTIQITNPDDYTGPTVDLLGFMGDDPPYTTPFDVTGTVSDDQPTGLFWTLQLRQKYSDATPIEIASGTGSFTQGVIATVDPNLYPDGFYDLELIATDSGGNTTKSSYSITIESKIKLGSNRVSFIDLEIPVAGIPIVVTRTYNSLNSDKSKDFGYGWTLDVTNTQIEVDYHFDNPGPGFAGYIPFRAGYTNLYVTLPDGTREGFLFSVENAWTSQGLDPGFADLLGPKR
ncbi:PKD domain-containing protein, partial [Thalassoglobus neptunius]|uniref:PKD domain-containing protein n=1 Tax=Thalassoglobus neptunius TaxID=1938619 RepID=UPI0011B422AF